MIRRTSTHDGRVNFASSRECRRVRRITAMFAMCAAACVAACSAKAPPSCCATIGYSRAQVEAVIGAPSPPQGSKYHPMPSPPPGSAVYTTEHGYLTVTYAKPAPHAARSISLDFYEGKDPATAYALIAAYLPSDAKDTGMRVIGSRSQDRVFKGARGYVFVQCFSSHPERECDRMEIGADVHERRGGP